jgi:hypothetical protein
VLSQKDSWARPSKHLCSLVRSRSEPAAEALEASYLSQTLCTVGGTGARLRTRLRSVKRSGELIQMK